MRKLRSNAKDSHEFKPILVEIEDEPSNPLGRFTLWVIVFSVVALLAWSFLAKVDVVVTARGKVEPFGGVKTIQPLETGSISAILVEEGDYVQEGQTLIEVDPSITETDLEAKERRLHFLNLQTERLEAMAHRKPYAPSNSANDPQMIQVQRDLHEAMVAAHESELTANNLEIESVLKEIEASVQEQARLERLLSLAETRKKRLDEVLDIIARSEYDQLLSEIADHQESIKTLSIRAKSLEFEKEKLIEQRSAIEQEFTRSALDQLKDVKSEADLLAAEIRAVSIRMEKQLLKSPINGFVNQLLVHTVGGVVTPAQPLVSVVPENSTLRIKTVVLNKDIGFIREGMPTTIKLDAFDFQKYGGLKGEVVHVPKDSVIKEQMGDVYEVLINPLEKTLVIEGELVKVSPGMTVAADIEIGKRRAIEFFIYPIVKYIDEGISVR